MADQSTDDFTFSVPKPVNATRMAAQKVKTPQIRSRHTYRGLSHRQLLKAGKVSAGLFLQNPLTSNATVVDLSNRQNGAEIPKPQPIPEPRLKPDQRPGKVSRPIAHIRHRLPSISTYSHFWSCQRAHAVAFGHSFCLTLADVPFNVSDPA